MSTWLSDRQKAELNKSVLDYLSNNGYGESAESFKRESNQEEFVADPNAKWSGLLEKKWTSVIRLQKKIMDLESKITLLNSELASRPAGGVTSGPSSSSSQLLFLPRAPPRHTLLGHRAPVTKVAFHPVFNVIVTASEDASIKVWDWETGEFERTIKGHTKSVSDVDFNSDGKLLASCSSDLSIKIWDVTEDYKCIKTFHHDHTVSSVRFLPPLDSAVVSASRDKTIRIWELSTGHCIKTIQGHDDWIRCVAPSIDGSRIVSCSNDQTAKMFSLPGGENRLEFRGHDHVIEVCVFAPANCNAAIRELSGLEILASFVATGSRDKTIKLWDTTSGQCLWTFSGHNNWIRALVFHPSGLYLLSSSDDKTIKIWDLKTGRCTKTVEAHDHFVSCLTWGRRKLSPKPGIDGVNGDTAAEEAMVNVLASGSVDQSVKIWLP
ncbi:dynein regulator [Atractiella rhizophila]|nr:dynein regulator [Atractiella rhizophila]